MRVKAFVKLIRPQQWYKNLLIFFPLIFSFNLFNSNLYLPFIMGFILLCLVSSVNYILNDIKDIENDRENPEKRNRPLSSGKLTIKGVVPLAVLMLATSLLLGLKLNIQLTLTLLALFITNQFYTFYLKKIVIVDAMTIAMDFVWRALAGIALIKGVSHPPLSVWFIFGIFFIAFLLATGKRRSELALLGEDATKHRSVFMSHNEKTLDSQILIITSMIILFYTLYTMEAPVGDQRLAITIPLVVYAVCRYVYLLTSNNPATRNPEKLLRDIPLLIALIAWVLSVVVLLYVYPIYFE